MTAASFIGPNRGGGVENLLSENEIAQIFGRSVPTLLAQKFGAEGIGLCRTEHMFFEGERIVAFREMILAGDEAGRRAALAKLLPFQRADFTGLFEIMSGLPVTIRLLDPPLHEFLPRAEAEIAAVAEGIGIAPLQVASDDQRSQFRFL
jgi:phosphoenolpyruvate synthase/pyruvate phosphate dikinase